MRRYLLYNILFIVVLLSACSSQNNYSLDSARQVAIDSVMSHDSYTQNDGYTLKEVEAKSLECTNCYSITYEYDSNLEYSGAKHYSVQVIVQNDVVTDIAFTPMGESLPAIVDRFEYTCENKCGDGYCDDNVCQGANCTCEESLQNCPEDC